jgi:hypothetical protein
VLRIYKSAIVRETYGTVKGARCWKIRTNKQIKGPITRERYFKISKIPPTKILQSS